MAEKFIIALSSLTILKEGMRVPIIPWRHSMAFNVGTNKSFPPPIWFSIRSDIVIFGVTAPKAQTWALSMGRIFQALLSYIQYHCVLRGTTSLCDVNSLFPHSSLAYFFHESGLMAVWRENGLSCGVFNCTRNCIIPVIYKTAQEYRRQKSLTDLLPPFGTVWFH